MRNYGDRFVRSDVHFTRRADARAARRGQPASRTARPAGPFPVESLERRTLLTVAPVIIYDFNEPGGDAVFDSASAGGQNNGTLSADGGVLPERLSGDGPDGSGYLRFAGDYNNPWDFGVGGRVATDEPLHPILGGSGTIAYSIRTNQIGGFASWSSPAVTGAEQLSTTNDVFYGSIGNDGRISASSGNGPLAIVPGYTNDGRWYQMVHTRDAASGVVRTFVNGRLVAAVKGDTGIKQAEFNSIGALTVHNGNVRDVNGYYFLQGDLDQVEIFDGAVDPREVAARYGTHTGTAPQTPAVTGDNNVIGTYRVQWPEDPNVSGYIVRRATTAAGPWTEVAVIPIDDLNPVGSYVDRAVKVGETHYYQVTSFSPDGESAPALAAGAAKATGNGFVAHYWDSGFWGADQRSAGVYSRGWHLSSLPDQTVLVGNSVDYFWGDGTPRDPFSAGALRADNFSTAFTGKVHADEDGDYLFETWTDDDGILFVNGQLASYDPFGHGMQPSRELYPVTLQAGHDYDFLFLQAEQIGAAGARLNWMTPSGRWNGQGMVPVPADHLVATGNPPAAPTDVLSRVEGQQVTFDFTDQATNEWGYALERRPAGGGGAFETLRVGDIAHLDPGYGVWVGTTLTDTPLFGGTYDYRVRAYNDQGSAESDVVTVTVPGMIERTERPGARGFYIVDPAWGNGTRRPGDLPTVGPRVDLTENVSRVEFDYGQNSPFPYGTVNDDAFSTVFSGTLRSAGAGTYQIFLDSDDSGFLLVNGQVVSYDPGPFAARDPGSAGEGTRRVFPITLAADTEYNFTALQADAYGAASVVMKWVRPGASAAEVVPDEQFSGDVPDGPGGAADGAPLAPPALGVADENLGASFLTITWGDAATNEMRYVLERSTSTDFAGAKVVALPINSTSYTASGLTPGTQYYYRVRAANFYGEAAATAAVTTLATERVAVPPADLRGAARADGVHLAFRDASNNEDEFLIERATGSGSGAFAVIGSVPGTPRGATGSVLNFTDATAAAGADYVYRVRASNSGGTSAPSNSFSARAGSAGGTGADVTYYNDQFFTGTSVSLSGAPAEQHFSLAPPAPEIDTDFFSGMFRAELAPEFSEPYTFYTASDDGIQLTLIDRDTGEILVSGPRDGLRFIRGMPDEGFQETVGTASLTAGRRYLVEWRFSQYNGDAGYRVGWSSPSVPQEVVPTELLFPVDAATVPLVPVNRVSASAFGNESITVRWVDTNFGEDAFRVERKLASEPSAAFAAIGTVARDETSFSDTADIRYGTTYVYRVIAVRGAEDGAAGDTASVTPGTLGGFTYTGAAAVQPGPDGSLEDAADNSVLLPVGRPTGESGLLQGSVFTNNAAPIVSVAPRLFGEGTVRGFTVSFDVAYAPFPGPNSNESFEFIIQRNSPDAIGEDLLQGGYGGMPNSFAVGFQQAYQTTYTYVNGTIYPYAQEPMPFWYGKFGVGSMHVELEYDADQSTLVQRLSFVDESGEVAEQWERTYYDAIGPSGSESPLDIPTMIGGNYGFFGFAAGGPQAAQFVSRFIVNGQPVEFLPAGQDPAAPPPNAAPSADAGGPYQVAEGDYVILDASASSDPDGDLLTYSWDLNGDGTFGDATGRNPFLSWARLQELGIDDGPASPAGFTVRVDDQHGNVSISAAAPLAILNAAPIAAFAGPDQLTEGEVGTYGFFQVNEYSAADRAAGYTYAYAADFNRDGDFTDAGDDLGAGGAEAVSVRFPDDGVFNVRGRITDKDGGTSEYLFAVTVANAAPQVGAITAPQGARLVNSAVAVSADFTDAGTLDTHTAVWDWGDGSTSPGTPGTGAAAARFTGSHAYANPGLYTVKLTVTDDDGGSSTSTYRYVAVYSPAGSAGGAGWVGAARAGVTFDLRYRKGATVPSGDLSFATGNTLFRATSYDWLVVTRGGVAFVRGHGTVNGQAGYSFLLAVSDAGRKGSSPDRLRMKVWYDATGTVVYDNQPGDPDDAAPLAALAGGDFVLQAS